MGLNCKFMATWFHDRVQPAASRRHPSTTTAALVAHQPADRFWPFQLPEAAILRGARHRVVAAAVAAAQRRAA
jgi:hypothetical protein